MKLPVMFSEALVDAVLALSALLSESGYFGSPSALHHKRRSFPSHLQRRTLTSPAPLDFRYDNALTRRSSQSVLTASKKCMVQPAVKGGAGTGSGGNSTANGGDGVGLQGPKGGLIQVVDAACGPSGAVCEFFFPCWETLCSPVSYRMVFLAQVNVAAGPNGHINWIDCGISSSNSSDDKGWNPPTVLLPELVYMSLTTALQDPNTPFTACNAYLDQFISVATSKGLPAIMMASFAMQESGCDPKATGEGGEVGMFQLSPDKCTGVSDCFDAVGVYLCCGVMCSGADTNGVLLRQRIWTLRPIIYSPN